MLVAGGAGFIGAHLCRALLHEGHEVLALDNFYSGSRQVVMALLENSRFELIRHDITFPLSVEVDQIFNLACPASPVQYTKRPIQVIEASVIGSLNLLGLAKRLQVPILLTSTSEIYGNPTMHPQREDYWGRCNPVGPRACYVEGKRCAETLFKDYRQHHNVDAKIVRLFNTYGPGMLQNEGRVVSAFIVAALRGEPLTIHGDGEQTRAFCFVEDTVHALVKAMQVSFDAPINIGNPSETTVSKLAELVLTTTCSQSPIRFTKALPEDPVRRCPDITRAKKVLGWSPTVDLVDGLQQTVTWFVEQLSG